MQEKFQDQRFTTDSSKIITQAVDICDRYRRQGYKLSLRQLYYQFIAVDAFENSEKNYKRLGDIVSNGRLAGLIDWDMIEDRGRETVSNPHWDSPASILDSAARSFRIDTWADQSNHVEVMVEKQALEGVLEPVCRELDIRFTANKGYSSSSAMYAVGKRLQAMFVGNGSFEDYKFEDMRWASGDWNTYFEDAAVDDFKVGELEASDNYEDWKKAELLLAQECRPHMKPHPDGGKTVHMVYLGDHDPSGIDMTRDVRERLELFSRCPVQVHRIALNMDQVRRFNPPPNPAKLTDSRATDYVRRFGDTSWELDALNPQTLAGLVRGIVTGLRDDDLYEKALAKQQAWKDELAALADKYKQE